MLEIVPRMVGCGIGKSLALQIQLATTKANSESAPPL